MGFLKPSKPAPDPELVAQREAERAKQAQQAQQAVGTQQDNISKLFGSRSLLTGPAAPRTPMGSLGSDWLSQVRLN